MEAIPCVFHGSTRSRAEVEKPPIKDLVSANLNHYGVNTDYRLGMHFATLPTAFVSGLEEIGLGWASWTGLAAGSCGSAGNQTVGRRTTQPPA
jgi:uncharacterized protein DUF4055